MILFRNFFAAIILFIAVGARVQAQTSTNGVLAGWDFHALANGLNNFGTSPLAPTLLATNLAATGLVRGSGVGTTGTGAARGWGGNNFTSASYAAATNASQFATLGFAASNGFIVSFTNLSEIDYRRSSTGPASGVLQYQIGGGPFTDIANLAYPVSTSGGAALGAINLSGIAALQNVPGGTNVTFRVVNWGGTSSAGTWYFFDVSNSGALDLTLQGTIRANNNEFLNAYDSGVGFFGGENLILTNASGASIYVWSSTTPALSVTNWKLEGPMSELPLGTTGNSRYGFNANPVTSPTYYIFTRTNAGPFIASEPLIWLTTDDFQSYSVTGSNTAIRADGVFAIPAAPVLLQSPVATNAFAGRNISLSVVVSASGTLNYQWLQNSNVLADGGGFVGSQTNILKFIPVAKNFSGDYFVIVTNSLGSVTSSVASLNVVPVPPILFSNSASGIFLSAENGAVSNRFIVQLATNLSPPLAWLPYQTNVIGSDGKMFFAETNLAKPAAYYRIQIP